MAKVTTCAFKRPNGKRCRKRAALKYGGYCREHAWAGVKKLVRETGKVGLDVVKMAAAEGIARLVVKGKRKSRTQAPGKRITTTSITRGRPQHIRRGSTVMVAPQKHTARAQRRPPKQR